MTTRLNRIARSGRSAFTLIEMLVVIAMIALIVAIVLTALGGARNTARKTATRALLTDVGQASSKFIIDQRRTPGYFSPEEMGDSANETRGFPGMANVLLDLAGGISDDAPIGTRLRVGPTSASEINVDTGLIGGTGSQSGGYLSLAADNLATQTGPGQMVAGATAAHRNLPHLIDTFGNPILAWAEDDNVPPDADFAERVFTSGGRAHFYWASNAAFLDTTSLGQGAQAQAFAGAGTAYSLIGASAPTQTDSLAGALGHPAFPKSGATPAEPASARGTLIFHSAGADGVFFNSKQGALTYKSGEDGTERFDDLLVPVAN